MRVGVNARLLYDADLRGWNRYTVNLLAELPAHGVELVLYSDRPLAHEHLARLPAGSFEVRVGAARPHAAWEQAWLPRQCARDRIDVLHAPANFGLPWASPCPRVLTLHDAIDQIYYAPKMPWRDRWSKNAVRGRFAHWAARVRAHRIITVSDHARGDLVKFLRLPADRVRVIAEAADPGMLKPVSKAERVRVLAHYDLQRPYVFYVGGWEGRKNVPFLVRGFAAAGLDDVDLVLAGGRDDQRAALTELAESLGVGSRLRLIGRVPDAELPVLYGGALCFVYPSEYEGFGLQLCEAMACGCPTLAAHATCLPEVLGSGGDTFALDAPNDLAGLLRRVARDRDYRDELVGRARVRSGDFSWGRAAAATAAVYRELA